MGSRATLFVVLSGLLTGCSPIEPLTGIRGQVLETETKRPIENVEVGIGSDEIGWTLGITDPEGWFEIRGFDLDSTRMLLNGKPASAPGHRYPSVQTQLHPDWVQVNYVTTLGAPKWLPVIDETTSVDFSDVLVIPDSVPGPSARLLPSGESDPTLSNMPQSSGDHPASEGWLQIDPNAAPIHVENDHIMVKDRNNPDGPKVATYIYYDFQPGTYLKFPEGAEHVISITQLPVDQLPHNLPEYVNPENMVASHPGGTFIDPPVQLHFGSGFLFEDYPKKEAWSLAHSLALFLNVGDLEDVETERGVEYTSLPGEGLRELGWHAVSVPAPCNNTNFYANVKLTEDDTMLLPPDGSVVLSVGGRGFTNRAGRVETGFSANIGCSGTFDLQFRGGAGAPWTAPTVNRINRGPPGSTLCLGNYLVDLGAQTLTRTYNSSDPACDGPDDRMDPPAPPPPPPVFGCAIGAKSESGAPTFAMALLCGLLLMSRRREKRTGKTE